MGDKFGPKTRMELDYIGQYYASVISKKQACVFCISAYLKEPLDPQVLQQAVNDLMRRLPFLSGRLRRGFFHYKHEILPEPPQIIHEHGFSQFGHYYNNGSGHVLNVVYGERYFTVNAIHSICDGRGLMKITSALLVRYLELLGIKLDKSEIIDCSGALQPEEAENAFLRFARGTSIQPKSTSHSPQGKAYRPKHSESANTQVITQKFSVSKLKTAAKEHNATITECILAHIFKSFAIERAIDKDKKPITAMLPIDCRNFFPSETLRSFVSSTKIIMPETEDYSDMIQQLRSQFEGINKDTVQYETSKLQKMYDNFRFMPRVIKKHSMKMMERSESPGFTTGLSNVGVAKLPKGIEEHIDMLEFAIGLEEDSYCFFTCISFGDTLTLTATTRDGDETIANRVMDWVRGM